MRRTSIFLDPSVEQDLKGIARRRAVPVASVVREALLDYVTTHKLELGALPSFTAIGRSGRRDTATQHEDLLFADLAAVPEQRSRSTKSRRRG